MKRTLTLMLTVLLLCTLLFGCGQKNEDGNPQDTNTEPALADGVYTADFNTDSSMFHVNEACEGKGTLTVENGQMTIHISLPSKSILNLFCGTAEDARKAGAAPCPRWTRSSTSPSSARRASGMTTRSP